MRSIYSIRFLLTSLCTVLLLAGCAQTTLKGERNGWGMVQPYNSEALPMPVPPLKSSATDGDTWAAMAYTDQIAVLNDPEMAFLLGIGIAENYATATEAQNAAMHICESDGIPGCQIKAVFQSQCMAIAYDHANLVYSWSINATKEDAENQAIQLCEQQTQNNACKPFGSICPRLAGQPAEEPFTETNPEDAALLAHNLAIFARNAAILRDQGISREDLSKQFEHGDEASGEAALNAFYILQIKLVYGPYKNFSPEQIYRTQMFSTLYEMMQ